MPCLLGRTTKRRDGMSRRPQRMHGSLAWSGAMRSRRPIPSADRSRATTAIEVASDTDSGRVGLAAIAAVGKKWSTSTKLSMCSQDIEQDPVSGFFFKNNACPVRDPGSTLRCLLPRFLVTYSLPFRCRSKSVKSFSKTGPVRSVDGSMGSTAWQPRRFVSRWQGSSKETCRGCSGSAVSGCWAADRRSGNNVTSSSPSSAGSGTRNARQRGIDAHAPDPTVQRDGRGPRAARP